MNGKEADSRTGQRRLCPPFASKRVSEVKSHLPFGEIGRAFHHRICSLTGQYDMSVDFRRQLKARLMEYNIPVQLIRESTLAIQEEKDGRGLTCLSDRAWNLCTAIYHKAGGKPWRLSSARDGVCYVGLVFKQTENKSTSKTACCAAQMFLDTGDGVVFRGEFGPWYSPLTKEFHLDPSHAESLLKGVIETYKEQGGKNLKEIFLHSRSSISLEEFQGYQRACPKDAKLVAIRAAKTRDELRLYRQGKWCVQRGTFWPISDNVCYLWASGFKPDLLTYDGWERATRDFRLTHRDYLAILPNRSIGDL
ncbi:hypothetical protein ACFLQU_03395 [Verrucomicrobiota bacterium]